LTERVKSRSMAARRFLAWAGVTLGCMPVAETFVIVLGYKGIWGAVTQGKRAPDFFLPYNKKRQDLHLSLHNKYFSEKTS
jgi:hypothetical protein